VTAILVQRDVGGNLAEILDKISYTIRERFMIQRQIRVYTAQGRMTGYLLAVLPIIMGVLIYMLNAEYMSILFTEPVGRFLIAGALVLKPELLVADEPVSMLDVSIRAEILTLLRELRETQEITILYTTHDLATAGYFTDRMAVMYLGRVVELGPTVEVLANPRHPYTQSLVSIAPVPNPRRRRKRTILQGEVPNPIDLPSGCRFHPRCPLAVEECKKIDPRYVQVGPGHEAACLLLE